MGANISRNIARPSCHPSFSYLTDVIYGYNMSFIQGVCQISISSYNMPSTKGEYSSVPSGETFIDSELEMGDLPHDNAGHSYDSPPPSFNDVNVSNKPYEAENPEQPMQLDDIARSLKEINRSLALLIPREPVFDPESLTESENGTPRRQPNPCTLKMTAGIILFIMFCFMFLIWFCVYLNIWYERETKNLQ